MKILMTTDPLGGVWTYTLELAAAVREHDVDVAVASMGASLSPAHRREARAAGVAELYATDLALEWMHDRWGEVTAAGEWLLRVRDDTQPDAMHLNGYVHAALPWELPVVVVAHSCVYSWFAAVRGHRPGPDWERYRTAVERGLRSGDVVVAPTAAMLDALDRHYSFAAERAVIYNGRAAVDARPKERFVLAAGRAWDEAKNIAAVEHVASDLPWPTRIVGQGAREGAVSRGVLDDLLARASIFCAPARYEPFGLGALEAGLAGCALVLGDIPSLREVWGDAATFVEPDDLDALREVLRSLIADDELRAERGEHARARAARYTPERMANEYVDLYAQLLTREWEEVA